MRLLAHAQNPVIVAEEDARMGFPEVLFNLFPGMGAYSFLSRKVGRRTTEELITSGAIYTARQLYDMGVVDVITPTGTGEAAVESYVRKHQRAGNGRRGIESIAKEMNPLSHEELVRIVELWADAAMPYAPAVAVGHGSAGGQDQNLSAPSARPVWL